MKVNKKIEKINFIWNMIGTTFNSFNSLFFMILVTRINGIESAGIFTFAYSTACLFYVIGSYSGRTYQVTDEDDYNDSIYFYSKIITCIFMILSIILFCFIKEYSFYKIVIIILLGLFKMLEALSETFYAIIQKDNELHIVGKSMFLKAIISLILFFIVDVITKNLILSCLFIILTNLLIILFYDLRNIKNKKFKLEKIDINKTIELLKKGFFAFGFAFMTLYIINAPKYSVDVYMSNKDQTILGIIIMPATIIILFSQYIIQPFIIKMKNTIAKGRKEFDKIILKIVFFICLVGGVSIICSWLLGIPVLELLYGVELDKYLVALITIIIGATIYGISVVYSTALTTLRKTFCQFIAFLITSIFAFVISDMLTKSNGIFGACYSYMITMIFLLFIYIIIYKYQLLKKWKNK